ncbi:MAG: general secretion pathway protein GspK [Candidatus Omnitrophica bacterium]|nr:general secretion pathway protein GspK [Candidatus Omnitrophota bacterium]
MDYIKPYKKVNNKALILIVALWIVAILTLLAIGLAHRISIELHLIRFSRDRLKACSALEAAVQSAAYIIAQDINGYDSMNEIWANGIWDEFNESIFKDVKLKQAVFSIIHKVDDETGVLSLLYGLSDEQARLNINTATANHLQTFFLEAEIENSREISASILDWIDEDEITSFDGAEDDYYTGLDMPYHCKNAPLSSIEELLFIKGMDPDKFEKIKPFITVYGDGKININTVSELLLSSLLISRGTLDSTARKLAGEVVDYRLGDDGEIGTVDDRIFEKFQDIVLALSSQTSLGEFAKCADIIKFNSSFFRADIWAQSLNKVAQKRALCILEKDRAAVKMPKVVKWQEY